MKSILHHKMCMWKGPVAAFLLIVCSCFSAIAQDKQITGKVTLKGETAPGITIKVKESGAGTSTDANGAFKIQVPKTATLVFSYTGYLTREIQVGEKTSLTVDLDPDVKTLTEVSVVSVGYGTVRKKDLTGAVSSVSADQIANVPVTTLGQALQGRASGVQVTNNDGSPGAPVQVLIRGLGSLSSNEPLYVIDGFPGGISSLNQNDIESIDILKDASATAIYGNRASNGVVIITTKRGSKNGVQTAFSVLTSIQSRPKTYDVLNASDWATLAVSQSAIDGWTPLAEWKDPAALRSINWQDEVYRNALKQQYDMSIRGGNEKVQGAVSGSYFDQQGIVLGNSYKKFNLGANLDYNAKTWLKSATSIKFSRNDTKLPLTSGFDGIAKLSRILPTMTGNKLTDQVKDANGNYGFFTPTIVQTSGYLNPVYAIETTDLTNVSNAFLGTSSLEATLFEGFKIKTNLGINVSDNAASKATPTDTRAYDQYKGSAVQNQNYYSQSANNTYEWLWENTIAYTKTFDQHSFDFVGGVSQQKNTYKTVGADGRNFQSDILRNLGSAPTLNSYFGSTQTWALASQFGRVNYKFMDRYLLTATVRRDGSSRFAPGNQYGVFPSGSIAWKVKEERFLKDVNFITDLKLRGSYGEIGNQSVGLFQYLSQYTTGGAATTATNNGYPFNKVYQAGLVLASLPNPELKWETSKQTDIGFDAAFLNGDLTLTVDYYEKKSKDFLLAIPVPAQTGFVIANRNVGSISNKGIEIAINYRHQSSKDFNYGIGFNITTVKNKLLSLAASQTYINNLGDLGFVATGSNNWVNYSRSYIGGAVGEFYGFKTAGIFQNQAQIDALNAEAVAKNGIGIQYQPNAKPGDRMFKDLNGDGKITADDQTSLGSPLPKFFGGLNLDASYKSFDINVFFYGVAGNKIFNYMKASQESFLEIGAIAVQNISKEYLDKAWTPANQSNRYARITSNDQNGNNRPSDQWVENGSYLRLRNLQIGYTLPASTIKKLGLAKLRIYVAAQNLFTLTNYTGLDPEIGSPTDQTGSRKATAQGVDVGTYPLSRIYNLGLNVSF